MVLEIFIDIERVQIFAVESGQQHIDDDGDIDFVFVRIVFVGILVVFDAFLNILIVHIEFTDAVVGTVLVVVVFDNSF